MNGSTEQGLTPTKERSRDDKNVAKRRRNRRNRRKVVNTSGLSEKSSVMFLLLIMGLVFCLIDVFYVISYIDNIMEAHTQSPFEASGESDEAPSNDEHPDPHHDKEHILKLLGEAGIKGLDYETIRKLPTWSKITSLYGDHPRIYGLDQCKIFQEMSDPGDHLVGVAGAFNSGTNLMSELLIHNCHMPKRMKKHGYTQRGIRWQVPWGKHNPPSDEKFRLSHKTVKDWNIDARDILSAVTIRDPYSWMGSMCRIKYGAKWLHSTTHCPNLVPSKYDIAMHPSLAMKNSVPVNVKYSGFSTVHKSLAHMWNDWYADYTNATFPRIIVRFEDLVFHAREVTETVCKCAGGEMNKGGFRYISESAKKGIGAHGSFETRTTLVDAMMRYGTDKKRFKGYNKEDLIYAKENLNRDLVEFFAYSDPPARLLE